MKMAKDEIQRRVQAAYIAKYRGIGVVGAKVTSVEGILSGAIVVVDVVKERQQHQKDGGASGGWEEACYITAEGDVQIFDTTTELVTTLVRQAGGLLSVKELQTRRGKLESGRWGSQNVFFGSLAVMFGCFITVGWSLWQWQAPTAAFLSALGGCAAVAVLLANRKASLDLAAETQELDYQIESQLSGISQGESRADKNVHLNHLQLRRYYDRTLQQGSWVFVLGVVCIFIGAGIVVYTLWLLTQPAGGIGMQWNDKIITAVFGGMGALLTNYVAAIYLKMHTAAATSLLQFHERLVETHQALFGNLVASRIGDEDLRWQTLAKIALHVSKVGDSTTQLKANEEAVEA